MGTLEQTLKQTHDWAIDRITILTEEMDPELLEDAFSIEREFDEWLAPENDDHEIFSLEYIGEGSEYE